MSDLSASPVGPVDCPSTQPRVAQGVFKSIPDDFRVDELLPFEPSGSGEFLLVRVCKRDLNTEDVAAQLATVAGLPRRAVEFAGRKDRHAVARQWFGLHLPGVSDPRLEAIQSDRITIEQTVRHHRKLRRGAVAANRFTIVVRSIEGEPEQVDAALRRISDNGVPNYFGPQRFGNDGANLRAAERLAQGARLRRSERSMALSAARSDIFNAALAERVRQGCWERPIDGDVFMFADGTKCFGPEPLTEVIRERVASGEIDPTGPLFGSGELRTDGEARVLEESIGAEFAGRIALLANRGLRQERRRLRLAVNDLTWSWAGMDLNVAFTLQRGAFATAVLGEFLTLQEAS